MTDFLEMTITTDRVDAELVALPRRWNMQLIRRFTFTFGILTFGVSLLVLGAIVGFNIAAVEIAKKFFYWEVAG